MKLQQICSKWAQMFRNRQFLSRLVDSITLKVYPVNKRVQLFQNCQYPIRSRVNCR